jgi:hypothetical protein
VSFAVLIAKFLTHKTTCASEMLEKTTCQKIYQKRPLRVAARLARRHVARAATANAGMGVPPQPTPARLLPFEEVGPAATAKSGRHAPRHPAGNG